jgi:hypothetical protein
MTMGISFSKHTWRRWVFPLLSVLFLLSPLVAQSDPLGEFLLKEIKAKPNGSYSDATLLLMTRDLGWYEENMGQLSQAAQDRVQAVRIGIVGESTRSAAEALGEPADVFLASGSCKPGRDIDLLYVGKDTHKARRSIDAAIVQTTAGILAKGGEDPLLQAARKQGLEVPKNLTSSAMDVVASDLPNFGYNDLKAALSKARGVQKADGGDALVVLKKEMHEALKRNLDAQVAASAKDMYRGGAGQRFFVMSYLGDPEKVRRIAQQGGGWVLKPGGAEALSGLLLEQVTALMPTSRRALFAKVASDYAMFFKHGEGGIGGTAKYVDRIWEDVDEIALISYMDDDEGKAILTARDIAQRPSAASAILADAGLSEVQVIDGVKRGMYQAVENQLLLDVNRLITELEKIEAAKGAKALDDLELLYQKQLIKFDLNDLANGLTALSDVPGGQAEAVLKTLQREFGNRSLGPNVLGYIERQLKLITGESADKISRRLLMTLLNTHEITPAEYYELNRHIQNGTELPAGPATQKLKQARQEVLYLSSVDMLELGGGANSIDTVVEDWRRQRSNAIIRTVPDEVRQTVKELKALPADELKALGWLEAEIRLPMETRLKIKLLPDQMADMADRLQRRLGKQALSLMEWQRQTRQYIFSLTPTEFGQASDIGALDAVFSVANGLYQTYAILNSSPAMKPDEENLALANAWVTALPIVGDFADGILAGIEAGFTGNKRKALEAGLYVSIGIMAVVPGGQIPAVVTGLIMAGTPLAEGAYDARQAQHLIQAWIDSGDWEDGGNQPLVLNGLFDRAHVLHALTYADLLTPKGDAPYASQKADGLFAVPTINASIREYAEKYIFPQYPRLKELRESLKLLFPNFNDKDWEDEFDAKLKVQTHGGKAALLFFAEYRQIRTQALNQTIAHLKAWAEEENRVAKDYEGEISKAKDELRGLEAELKVGSLVAHADQSAQAYTQVVKNTLEQESLPLSRFRIYKHYLQEYRQIAVLHRKIKNHLAEVPEGYKPANWHLTGYPEFDRPRMVKLAAMMDNGRAHAVTHVEKLVRDFGFSSKGGFDPGNPCHKKALQILLSHRYKICFIENLVEYFTTLAEAESAWNDAYDAARSRYIEVRENYADIPTISQGDAAASALGDAVITFVAAMPYALASGERELYRGTASDFRIKMDQAMRDYEHAGFLTGEAGKALETCLMASLKVEISLSPMVPKGKTTRAKATLGAGTPPAEYYFRWKKEGALSFKSPHGAEVQVTVDGPGTLTVEMMDDFREGAKLLAQASMRVVPGDAAEKKEDKEEDPLADLSVTLKAPTQVVDVGTQVTLSASVGGGTPAYRYRWSGVSSSSAGATFTPAHVGDWSISVQVTDAKGQTGEAVATVRVGPAKVKIKGAEGEVYYGSQAFLSVSGMGLAAPAPAPAPKAAPVDCSKDRSNPFCVDTTGNATYTPRSRSDIPDDGRHREYAYIPDPSKEFAEEPREADPYRVIWLSEPGLTFDPPEGSTEMTQVTYDRLDEVKIWCQLLKYIDGAYQTVAESEQVTVNVVPPALSISYEPANGRAYVGQQVIATVHAKPGVDGKLINYRWLDPPFSNRLEMDPNGRRIAFTVRDTNPIQLKALARVPVHGDELGEVAGSYTGMAYGVNAWMVQPPNLPRTWDPKAGGLKTIPRTSRATHERIFLKAELVGESLPDGVRWNWKVNPGTSLSNDISQSPTVSRSEPGTITARVTALNRDGNKLGEAEVSVEVIELVSAPASAKASATPAPADKKAAAKQMIDQTREHLARGDMPAAEKSALKAKEIDPKAAAPLMAEVATAAKKSGWRAVDQRDFAKAREDLQVADRMAPGNADTKTKLEKLTRFEKIWPQVEAKVPEFDKYVAEKRPFSAQKALLEIQKLQTDMPGGTTSPLNQRIGADFNKAFKEYSAFILDWETRNTQSFKEQNWQAMLDNSLAAQKRELSPARQKDIQSSIDFARQKLAQPDKPVTAPGVPATQNQSVAPTSGKSSQAQATGSQAGASGTSGKTDAPSELSSPLLPAPPNPTVSASQAGTGLKLAKTIYAPYEEITLDFTAASAVPANTWVGLIPSHVAHGSSARNDQHDSAFQNLKGQASGRMVFKAPAKIGQYDFRMSTKDKDQEIVSVTFTVAVPAQTAALTLPKKIFAPNEEIKLNFEASPQLPQNTWVGLIPEHVAHGSTARNDQHDSAFQTLKGQAKGQLIFRAPGKIGQYGFRMNETTNDQEVAAVAFEVAVPVEGNALRLPKTVFAPNEEIKLAFDASPLLPQNTWVGLIPEHVAHGSTARNDQHDSAFQAVNGQSKGQLIFQAPGKIGKYGFRMNETTNDKEVAAVAFEVAVPMGSNALRLPKTVFAPNEEIKLDFEASPLLPQNTWVGLIPEHVAHGSTARNDQHDSAFQAVKGQSKGQLIFQAPVKIGKYGFRMNETTNDKEVAAVAFEVAVPVQGNALTLPKATFAPNEEIKLNFKASVLLPKNTWVGLIPESVGHGSTARNDQHDSSFQTVNGRASGQMVFRAPAKPGKYDFRMNETTNDKEVAHTTFTVMQGKK